MAKKDAFDVDSHMDKATKDFIGNQGGGKVKPGLAKRRREAQVAGRNMTEFSERPVPLEGGNALDQQLREDYKRARSALERQERVARDEPAVEGGDRPSTIRARAKVKNRGN